jgi:vacuolar-type H+-ATPase subunit F/Vma7
MRIVAVGRAREVGGFALGGVETRPCAAAADAEAAVTALTRGQDVPGLLVVSPWAGRAAARAIAHLRERPAPPVVVVLPEIGEEEP